MNKRIRHILIAVFWIGIWQLASMAVQNNIILAGPADTALALIGQIASPDFRGAVFHSCLRIASGFLGAFAAGMLLSVLSARLHLVGELIEPCIVFMQSVPVASFVILLLFWTGSSGMSVWVVFLVVLPVIYRNMAEGIRQADENLKNVADIFRMEWTDRVWYLYRPAVYPYLLSGCKIALGIAWKSGVAAEVIAVAGNSIGEKLYLSKIYLDTAGLFAWTIVIIALNRLFEWVFLRFLRWLNRDLQKEENGK